MVTNKQISRPVFEKYCWRKVDLSKYANDLGLYFDTKRKNFNKFLLYKDKDQGKAFKIIIHAGIALCLLLPFPVFRIVISGTKLTNEIAVLLRLSVAFPKHE